MAALRLCFVVLAVLVSVCTGTAESNEVAVKRTKRDIHLFNVHEDRIDLVLAHDRRWPRDVKVAIVYCEKTAKKEVEDVVALEPTLWKRVLNMRIIDGPLRGFRKGVIIKGLQPDTTYTVKEVVYVKVGDNYIEREKYGSQWTYLTLASETNEVEDTKVENNQSPKQDADSQKPLV